MEMILLILFKPVATIMKKQNTIDLHGNPIEIKEGRDTMCVVLDSANS